jgi:hypothetical protein
MAAPYHHAVSSAKRFGGDAEGYLEIHRFFDRSKEMHGDFRHRALRHHTHGIFECERVFGETMTNSNGRIIPVRWVAEQHIMEDLGFLPTLSDWLSCIQPKPWMTRSRRLSENIERGESGA